jgi:hypothetical protein
MKFNAYFWVRALLVGAVIIDLAGLLVSSRLGGYLLFLGSMALLLAGVTTYRDYGGVGSGFAETYLRMLPRWYPRGWPMNSNANLYRWQGIVMFVAALVTFGIGLLIAGRG